MGGLKADAITDLIQGGTIALGIVALAFTVFGGEGGVSWGDLPSERLTLLDNSRSPLENMELWAVPVLGSLFTAEIVARVAASRSAAVAQGGALAGGLIFLGLGTIVALLGVAASTMEFDGAAHSEQILLTLAAAQLGPFWVTLFSAALVAAILSTVDSALLTAGSLLAHNIVIPLRPRIDDRARLRLNRLSVVGFGLIAYALANLFESVYELIEQASAFAGAGVVVVTPIALFSRVGGVPSAISSLLAGLFVYSYGAYLAQWPYPYLTSVAAAAFAYATSALIERQHSTRVN
jgi:Na+/proline symporter